MQKKFYININKVKAIKKKILQTVELKKKKKFFFLVTKIN